MSKEQRLVNAMHDLENAATDLTEEIRRWMATCGTPRFADSGNSREFCRCERCRDRRERRLGFNDRRDGL